ncbi:MAG: hypothetical protein LBE56_03765 [Tannerella sp.]|nr:hypothetical protein [Tannerella sp.]
MNISNDIRKALLERANRLLHYNNLLIEQCDSWLTAEEGNRNMLEQIEASRKREKELKRQKKKKKE